VIFVAKLLEVKQVADETANNYFMGIEIKHWLSNHADVILPAAIAAQWTGLDQKVRDTWWTMSSSKVVNNIT
jgi:hypothetical protein